MKHAALLLLLGLPALAWADPAPSASVQAVRIQTQTVPRLVTASGDITAGAGEQALTTASATRLVAVLVMQGQAVAAGQALAQFAPDPEAAAGLAKARDAVTAAAAARAHIAALLPAHLATGADLAAATQGLADAQAGLAALLASDSGVGFTLRAPADGLVTALPAAPGSLPAGATVAKFVPATALEAAAGLPPDQARYVAPGDAASLTLLDGRRIPAIVVQLAAALDPQTGLQEVWLRPQGAVMLGAPVAVSIQAGTLTGVVAPNAAVLQDETGTYVYQLDAQDIAHRHNVTVLQEGAQSSVLSGLDPAEKLATIGAYQLSDGMTARLGTAP